MEAGKLGVAPTGTIASIYGPIESLLGSIGLRSPVHRLLFTTLAGTATEFAFKPSYAFNSDGTARQPILLTRKQGDTYIPAGLLPTVLGLLMFLFV